MCANGGVGSGERLASAQKHISTQCHLPFGDWRMMCSHESVPIGPGTLWGRMAMGGIAGGWLSGLGGGFSLIESQSGICLHDPSPLQNHSHWQCAATGGEPITRAISAMSAKSEERFIETSLRRSHRSGNAPPLSVCYGLYLRRGVHTRARLHERRA
jgi:hypothetical protein